MLYSIKIVLPQFFFIIRRVRPKSAKRPTFHWANLSGIKLDRINKATALYHSLGINHLRTPAKVYGNLKLHHFFTNNTPYGSTNISWHLWSELIYRKQTLCNQQPILIFPLMNKSRQHFCFAWTQSYLKSLWDYVRSLGTYLYKRDHAVWIS